MTTPAHPGRMLFVNIPVADLERSKAFFARLGFTYNPRFTDETAACMLVGEQAFVMLLSHETFAQFAHLPMADPTTHALALYCFSASSARRSTRSLPLRSPRVAPRRMAPRTTASCTRAASSTSTATAGRSWDGSGGGAAGPRGVRGLHAGCRRPGLTRQHVPHVCRRRAGRQGALPTGACAGTEYMRPAQVGTQPLTTTVTYRDGIVCANPDLMRCDRERARPLQCLEKEQRAAVAHAKSGVSHGKVYETRSELTHE